MRWTKLAMAGVLLGGVSLVGTQVWAQAAAAPKDGADPLAELAALGSSMADNGQQAGGSIRAKKDVDTTVLNRQNDPKNLEAKVEEVRQSKFPGAAIKLKVLTPSKDGAGKDLKKSDSIVIIPRYKVEKGQVIMTDPDTLLNAGSFYLQKGDTVKVRLGEQKNKVWEAEYIERK